MRHRQPDILIKVKDLNLAPVDAVLPRQFLEKKDLGGSGGCNDTGTAMINDRFANGGSRLFGSRLAERLLVIVYL